MPTTRGVAIGIIPVLTAAFVILYLFPTRTTQLWAWTINPTMTAMLMGGGYITGAYFFFRVATTRRWHRVGVGFPAVGYLSFAFDRRWSSFRHLLEVATLGIAFIGIAAVRAADEFNGPRGIVVAWRIGLVVALILLVALQVAMNRPAPSRA